MTHRHKTQTDEHELKRAEKILAEADALLARATRLAYGCLPTDSNHGSRTDSNTRGGKA